MKTKKIKIGDQKVTLEIMTITEAKQSKRIKKDEEKALHEWVKDNPFPVDKKHLVYIIENTGFSPNGWLLGGTTPDFPTEKELTEIAETWIKA